MAIEVRQLLVKSNVVQPQEPAASVEQGLSAQDMEAILAECRALIREMLREEKER